MIEILKTNTKENRLENVNEITKGTWVNLINPTTEEIENVAKKLDVNPQLLRYPLDVAEKPHIDDDEGSVLINIDVPVTEISDGNKIYSTMPLGMVLVRDDYFITISRTRVDVLNEIINSKKKFSIFTDKKSRLVFQILYMVAEDYIRYMGYISRDIDEFEKSMHKSMKNKELVSLLDFEKTMIYFNTSAKANQTVLQKLSRGKSIKLYEEDEDILDDTIIENRQAIEMIQTYSEILNGIIDIFGTIVSNNLNIVMKFLTSITVIIAIPTLITSFMGMNVNFPFLTNIQGFFAILGLTILSTLIVTLWLKKKDML